MIRLLYFCSDYMIGLTQAQTATLVEMARHHKELEALPISSQNEQEEGLFTNLAKHEIFPRIVQDLDEHKDFKKKAKEIAQIIKSKRIEIVNVQNNWQLALAAYIKYVIRPGKFKIIYTIHGYRHNSFIKRIPAIVMIGTALLLFADRVISMSGYVSKRFWFVGYKTDLVFYMMTQPAFNKPVNNISKTPLRLIFPAQFRKGKNQLMIIRAVSNYIQKTGDATIRLILPGNGYLLNDYKKFVEDNELNEYVSFPGKLSLDEVISETEKCNIAVISSNVETYGRCITEPFCLGRCVITRPTGIATNIIHHGKNGFLFNNDKELTDILIQLHETPELVTQCANQAFEDKKVFNSDNVFQTYLTSLQKCLRHVSKS